MKKTLIMSSLAIIAAALLIGGGTYSYFSDSALSGGNIFTAGNIDLKVKDNDQPWGDSVSATWTSTNMKPGDELPFSIPQVEMKNIGSLPASSLDISASNSVPGYTGTPADDMDKYMQITRMEYSDTIPTMDLVTHTSDVNGNGWIDLDDLEQGGITGLPAPVGIGCLSMDLRFRPEAGNAFQGMTLVTSVTLTLRQ